MNNLKITELVATVSTVKFIQRHALFSVDPISSLALCFRLLTLDRVSGKFEIYACKAEDFDILINLPVKGQNWQSTKLGTLPVPLDCDDCRIIALGRNTNQLFITMK